MHPAILALGAVGLGWAGKKLWDDYQLKQAQAEVNRQKVIDSAARELIAGKTYAVQMMVTPDIGTRDVAMASNVIASSMQQLGFKLLGSPQLRNDAARKAFESGQPSEWLFTGVWRLASKKYLDVVPKWLGSALPFQQPAIDDPSAIIAGC